MTDANVGPVFNVITRQRIEELKATWLQSAGELRKKLAAITEEVDRINAQLLALDGANQACDVFINIANIEDTNLPTQADPEPAPAAATAE